MIDESLLNHQWNLNHLVIQDKFTMLKTMIYVNTLNSCLASLVPKMKDFSNFFLFFYRIILAIFLRTSFHHFLCFWVQYFKNKRLKKKLVFLRKGKLLSHKVLPRSSVPLPSPQHKTQKFKKYLMFYLLIRNKINFSLSF